MKLGWTNEEWDCGSSGVMNSVPPRWSGRYMAVAVDSESVIKETFANVRFNP